MHIHDVPSPFPRSTIYGVTVNGSRADVAHTAVADFVSLTMDGPVEVAVRPAVAPSAVALRPLSAGISPLLEAGVVRFTLNRPANVVVDIEGAQPLYVFAYAPEHGRPARSDPNVVWLEGGKVHELGEVSLVSGQTVYVEEGAVLRGSIRVAGEKNITVCGRGIIDGSYWRERGERRRGVLFQDCERVSVRDVTIVNPAGWTLVFYTCENVHVAGVREIGEGFGSDGIDVVASRHVLVEDCFVRSGDDDLVVKAFGPSEGRGKGGDVDDVMFRRCVLLGHGGSGMEIGHELRAGEIRNVTFSDCDILCVHGHGAALSIHNADRATVRDILFENIRIEHHFKHLIDFRIFESRWGKDPVRGHVRNVTLRNVAAALSEYNPGYTVSLIGGWDSEHVVDGVRFENVTVGGRRLTSPDDFDLYIRHARNISFS